MKLYKSRTTGEIIKPVLHLKNTMVTCQVYNADCTSSQYMKINKKYFAMFCDEIKLEDTPLKKTTH